MPDEHVEYLTENVCFDIPANSVPDEELLALCSAIKYYISNAQIKNAGWCSMMPPSYKRVLAVFTTVICPDIWMRSVIQHVLGDDVVVVNDWPGLNPDSFDMYHRMDHSLLEVYRELSPTFHAAMVYGILYGSEAMSMIDFPLPEEQSFSSDILVIEDEDGKIWETLGRLAESGVKVQRMIRSKKPNFCELIRILYCFKLVVGYCGLETYAACCMKKAVIEIYPTTLPINWLSKWMNKHYKMIVRDKIDTSEDLALVAQTVHAMWHMKAPKLAGVFNK